MQLIDDKKSLSEKCEQLVHDLKTVDKKYQDKIKTLEDKSVFTTYLPTFLLEVCGKPSDGSVSVFQFISFLECHSRYGFQPYDCIVFRIME